MRRRSNPGARRAFQLSMRKLGKKLRCLTCGASVHKKPCPPYKRVSCACGGEIELLDKKYKCKNCGYTADKLFDDEGRFVT